ncbi:hypothetical protein KEM55_006910 [Ascosphaera atra]|nr:hypothetical protein KEM55_006910 [Ascosphaera atra]
MSAKSAVLSKQAPAPAPFFSQAVKCNGMVYCSGALGVDPATGKLVDGLEKQTEQCLTNLSNILDAAGSSIDNVVKVNIFITDMQNFGGVNNVYMKVFNKGVKPCRTCVAVKELPMGGIVEIECTAHL